MKILTKHSGYTHEHDNKYLTYLIDNDGTLLSCSESIGEKAKLLVEKELMAQNGDEIEDVEVHDIQRFIRDNNLSITHDGQPLILVFYLKRDLMEQIEIIEPFSESINATLALKDANAMAFFLPTDGDERIECINPIITDEDTKAKVDVMITDIMKNFEIGLDEKNIEFSTEDPKEEE